jgi:ATP-dependent Lon protease
MRAGIRRVMLPARNRKDLEEVPAEAKDKIEFVFLQDVDAAVRAVLEPRREEKTPPV